MTDERKYPIVDPDPAFGRVVSNFNTSDYLSIFGFTSAGAVTAFSFGRLRILVCVFLLNNTIF